MTTRCVDWRRKSANGSPRLPLLNHISHLGWVFFCLFFFFTGFRCDVDWFNLRGRLWLEKGGRRGTQVARRLIGWDRYLVFFPALPSFIVVLLRFLFFFWWKKRENCGFVCWHLLRSWPSSTRVFKEKCSFFLFFFWKHHLIWLVFKTGLRNIKKDPFFDRYRSCDIASIAMEDGLDWREPSSGLFEKQTQKMAKKEENTKGTNEKKRTTWRGPPPWDESK